MPRRSGLPAGHRGVADAEGGAPDRGSFVKIGAWEIMRR